MQRGDVSFSFTDRMEEIEQNIADERFQSALALALTLPDICGGIAYPELIRRYRDGRIMTDRRGNPARDIGKQYIQWFDTYAAKYFFRSPEDAAPYLNGEKCWQLRCEYLHQNRGFDNESDGEEMHFYLGINCGTSICRFDTEETENGISSIRLDIQELCRRLCLAARAYYEAFREEKDFNLYNTPVIDFIKWQQEGEDRRETILILAENEIFASGLEQALRYPALKFLICTSARDAKRRLRKRRAAVWVAEEELLDRELWEQAKKDHAAVIPIEGMGEGDKERKGMFLRRPVLLAELRKCVFGSLEFGGAGPCAGKKA